MFFLVFQIKTFIKVKVKVNVYLNSNPVFIGVLFLKWFFRESEIKNQYQKPLMKGVKTNYSKQS